MITVTPKFTIVTDIIGLYHVAGIDATSVVSTVEDVLLRVSLNISHCRAPSVTMAQLTWLVVKVELLPASGRKSLGLF